MVRESFPFRPASAPQPKGRHPPRDKTSPDNCPQYSIAIASKSIFFVHTSSATSTFRNNPIYFTGIKNVCATKKQPIRKFSQINDVVFPSLNLSANVRHFLVFFGSKAAGAVPAIARLPRGMGKTLQNMPSNPLS